MSPSSPGKLCHDCFKQALAGEAHCADHFKSKGQLSKEKDTERRENDPLRDLYSQARWRHTRARILQRDPLCMVCGNHASTICDHIVDAHLFVALHHGDLESFYDESNHQGMCKACHDVKTKSEGKKTLSLVTIAPWPCADPCGGD